jgi:hypothetical protein
MNALGEEEAVAAVAAAIRRLFAMATEAQARDLARAVLRDLAAEGLALGRPAPPAP